MLIMLKWKKSILVSGKIDWFLLFKTAAIRKSETKNFLVWVFYDNVFDNYSRRKLFKWGNYSKEETIQGRKLLIIRRFWLRKLFKGGNYSREETIWGNTVYVEIEKDHVRQRDRRRRASLQHQNLNFLFYLCFT